MPSMNNAQIAAAPKAATAAPPIPAPSAPAHAVAPPIAQKPAPAVVAKLEPQKAESTTPAKPAPRPPINAESEAVFATVNVWAIAWSAMDIKSYLILYDSVFETL